MGGQLKRGTRIRVTGGGGNFSATVIGANDLLLIVSREAGCEVYIRRDPASMTPMQWRIGGKPVEVSTIAAPPAEISAEHSDFRRRLHALEQRTRPTGEKRNG
jgi:hypothetical protein